VLKNSLTLNVQLRKITNVISVSENEIVCYNVGNAITNAKSERTGPRFGESGGIREARAWVPTRMVTIPSK